MSLTDCQEITGIYGQYHNNSRWVLSPQQIWNSKKRNEHVQWGKNRPNIPSARPTKRKDMFSLFGLLTDEECHHLWQWKRHEPMKHMFSPKWWTVVPVHWDPLRLELSQLPAHRGPAVPAGLSSRPWVLWNPYGLVDGKTYRKPSFLPWNIGFFL